MKYGYFLAGTGQARWHRMTWAERRRLKKRRRKMDDLAMVRT